MITKHSVFAEEHVLQELKHYLPAQAPLKDFIHHNTLHAFQQLPFNEAMHEAKNIFGYKTTLSLEQYRALYQSGKIANEAIEHVLSAHHAEHLKDQLMNAPEEEKTHFRIGALRAHWKSVYQVDLDNQVHPLLFRILCSYLDQGISMWAFPIEGKGFLSALRALEKNSHTSFFKSERVKQLLLHSQCRIGMLLQTIVGNEQLFEQYLFDQQFAHPGWSGMVSTIEEQPETLLDKRHITLHDFIALELLLEIDALDTSFGKLWKPLATQLTDLPESLFAPVTPSLHDQLLMLWQEAYEWTYYDSVIKAIQLSKHEEPKTQANSFQALFCIDDRECSLRRHIEALDPRSETFGTPGFFSVAFFYKPEHGKFMTKLCPAPVTPKHLIKETGSSHKHDKDLHLTKHSHALFSGWLISQTLGFWSALRLFFNLFKPSMGPATATSLKHMDRLAKLTIEHHGEHVHGLQVGYTIPEMVQSVEQLLRSIGLVNGFAPLIYVIGHGSSSVNNPHYAAYDCGACSGRPGSVNARVISFMGNHPEVRRELANRGIHIPDTTRFIAGLHDTTRDEMVCYDEDTLPTEHQQLHLQYMVIMNKALDENAKERSRRFEVINTNRSAALVHEKIRNRSVSLFEPRPELNHATNALCIIGRRSLTRQLFLDRRAFMNSYNATEDPDGKYLLNILKAAAPVCGGINLEYYFSAVDNQKLGAGTKLPHNVMGLIGVANGIDGDLRPGLPSQMIEVHDPLRLLMIVQHKPEVILNVLDQSPETREWFLKNWIHLIAVHPETNDCFQYVKGKFIPYHQVSVVIPETSNIKQLIESSTENIPVHLIKYS